MLSHKRVTSLAQHAAAFFKMSRSSVILANSRLSLRVHRQSFSESEGFFTTEALVRFLFEFRRQRSDAATCVFGLSVF